MRTTVYILKSGWIVWAESLESDWNTSGLLSIKIPGTSMESSDDLWVAYDMALELSRDEEYDCLPLYWRERLTSGFTWSHKFGVITETHPDHRDDISLHLAHPDVPKYLAIPQWPFKA